MKKILLASVAIAALCSAPALAADMPVKAPPIAAAPVFNWTGCYIGANIGGAWSRKSFAQPGTLEADGGSQTADGLAGGGQIGCDAQVNNNWVVGVQGMFDGASLKGRNDLVAFPGETWNTKIRSFGTVDARLGYLFNPTTLFYGKAGVGWVHDKFTFINPFGGGGTFTTSANNTRSGFDVGVGLSWMFARNWDFFVEYDHIFLGHKTVNFGGFGGGTFPVIIGQSFNKVLVGIDYRFDWGKSPVVAKY